MKKSRYYSYIVLLLSGLILTEYAALATQAPPAMNSISRIGVLNGHFVELASGKPFVPLGCNLLHQAILSSKKQHATFCPGVYDAAETEKMMADVAAHGLNTVRAFHAFAVGKGGILEAKTDRDISPAYLANVVDFLQAARRHGIHVIFTWDKWLVNSDLWRSEAIPGEGNAHFLPAWDSAMNSNNFILSLPAVRTRSNAIISLIKGIRKADPELLPVVLTWEIENETSFDATKEPLKSRPSAFSFAEKTYNLSTSEGSQNFMDDAFIQWCNASTDAVHQADPEALVSVGVFSFAAVGRPTPNHLIEDVTRDHRVPARPLALLRSKLDFINIHIYAFKYDGKSGFSENYALNIQSVEAPRLQREAARLGKPILIGETGIATRYMSGSSQKDGVEYPFDYRLGLPLVRDHLARLKEAGFAGALLWCYGTSPAPIKQEFPLLNTFPEYQDMLRETWQKQQEPLP